MKLLLKISIICFLAINPAWGAEVTPTAKDFVSSGKNRASVQTERSVFSGRLDLGSLLGTLTKKSEGMRLPVESRHLYQEIDPVPLKSSKVFTPWLNYFKQAVVFIMGKLDSERLKIARWWVSLHDQAGREIRTFSGVGNPPEAFYWNGRDWEYNIVAVGQSYIPEITLVDYYGARVNLPQKMFYLDRLVWNEPARLTAAFVQTGVFEKKQATFSQEGVMIIKELSNLINLKDALILEIECQGPDADLMKDRARFLKEYFERENLRLKKIRVRSSGTTGPAVIYLTATKRL